MTTTALFAAVRNASAPREGGCRACGRTGLPILPLRRAIVGTGSHAVSQNGALPKVPTAEGLRTLRTGYLYVLLDKKQWHAYAVTPEGCLRQFNPDEPPRAEPEPLSKACVTEGHDIVSSFFNVDTAKHQTAWVAFASDPWPRSVLEAYRTGRAPLERFKQLDLHAARDNPVSAGLVLTPDALQVDTQVFEYAQASEGDFGSVHGFHSRHGKHEGLRGFVRTAMQRHQLQQSVLALVLDDPVGRVQELNAMRMKWVEARAKWAAQPDRAYRKLTSDCLLQLRESLRLQANATTPSFTPVSGDGPPVFRDPELERRDEVQRRTGNAITDLEARYHEPQRAAFMAEYERQWKQFQQAIDSAGASWSTAITAAAFQRIDRHDYDGAVADSGIAYAKTMALCVRGGITEAPDKDGKLPPDGASVKLWQGWMNDPNSPPYQALALRQKSLIENFWPSNGTDGSIALNDTQKLYDAIGKLITSQEISEKLQHLALREAVAQTLAAVNAAAEQLKSQLQSSAAQMKPALAASVETAVMRATVAALLLHERVHVTQLKVRMSVAEYYALQCETLRQRQQQLLQTAGKQTRQQVRSLMASGVLSLQVNNPALLEQMIEVTLWAEGNARDVRARIGAHLDGAAARTGAAWSELVVGIGTLEPAAKQVLAGLKVSAAQAAQLARTGFAGIKGMAGSGGLLLAVGSLYLVQDSLQQNFQKLEETIGGKHPEALAAVYGSSLGLVGGCTEGVGIALEASLKGAQKAGVNVAEPALEAVRWVAKAGAVAGVSDAVQAGMAARRAGNAGDHGAKRAYYGAMMLSGIGTFAAAGAVYSGTTAIFGGVIVLTPLGWAILLGLAAYAVSKWAEGEESTPVERWARRSYFGKHDETPSVWWNKAGDADIVIAELNAATLGLEPSVGFRSQLQSAGPLPGGGVLSSDALDYVTWLKYRFVLPGFDAERSAYQWSLIAHRYSEFRKQAPDIRSEGRIGDYVGGQALASGSHQPPEFATPGSAPISPGPVPRRPDFDASTVRPRITTQTFPVGNGQKSTVQEVHGAIELIGSNIEATTLRVTYWPNRNEPDVYAEVTLQEVR